MPRDGSNVYSPPGGTNATTLTPISSSAYNSFVADIAQDQNTARPVVAGGTGATNAADARTNLGAGNVHGPTTTVDNTVPRFDGTGGDIQTSGVTIDDSNNMNVTGGTLTVTKTDDGATGAVITLDQVSASPAASDVVGAVYAQGKDSGGNSTIYGGVQFFINDPTNGSEDGRALIVNQVGGTLTGIANFAAGFYMQGVAGGDPGAGKINATEFQVAGKKLSAAPDAVLEDQRASGTDGGSATSGSWQTRVLNTEVRDAHSLITLSANQFTPSVDGWVEWSTIFYNTNLSKSRLYNVTDGATAGVGTSVTAGAGADADTDGESVGGCAVVAGKTYRIEGRVSNSQGTNGYGLATSFGEVEVYTRLKFWRT